MLKDDHNAVERLFKRYEGAGARAYVEKRNVVDRIIEELSRHAAIEEQLFYPVARAAVPDTEDIALESLEEHNIVKWVLSDLQTTPAQHERFDAKVTVLIENVRHHVEEEERDFFPKVRDQLGRKVLNDLGEAMALAKQAAPTHPHPRLPDTPPGNLVVGAAAGVADRIGDTVSGLAQGGVTAAGDIIATVLGRKKPESSPNGSKVARTTARRVRSEVADITEAAIEAAQKAKVTTKRRATTARTTARTTAKSAKSGATRTARSAKRGATSTTRTARKAATSTARTARKAATSTTKTAKRSSRAR